MAAAVVRPSTSSSSSLPANAGQMIGLLLREHVASGLRSALSPGTSLLVSQGISLISPSHNTTTAILIGAAAHRHISSPEWRHPLLAPLLISALDRSLAQTHMELSPPSSRGRGTHQSRKVAIDWSLGVGSFMSSRHCRGQDALEPLDVRNHGGMMVMVPSHTHSAHSSRESRERILRTCLQPHLGSHKHTQHTHSTHTITYDGQHSLLGRPLVHVGGEQYPQTPPHRLGCEREEGRSSHHVWVSSKVQGLASVQGGESSSKPSHNSRDTHTDTHRDRHTRAHIISSLAWRAVGEPSFRFSPAVVRTTPLQHARDAVGEYENTHTLPVLGIRDSARVVSAEAEVCREALCETHPNGQEKNGEGERRDRYAALPLCVWGCVCVCVCVCVCLREC